MSVIYLDDFFCVGENSETCTSNVKFTISLLERLCFIINYTKSTLIPSQVCKYLGLIFDSNSMQIYLSIKAKVTILKILYLVLKCRSWKIQSFANLKGKLIFACQDVEYGLLHTRSLEKAKIWGLSKVAGNFGANMRIPLPY